MKNEELIVLKGVVICFKPFLKPEEAMVYCNLGHTQMAKKLSEFGIRKTSSGYYRKEDLDLMMEGARLKEACFGRNGHGNRFIMGLRVINLYKGSFRQSWQAIAILW